MRAIFIFYDGQTTSLIEKKLQSGGHGLTSVVAIRHP
jgi:hypothetical protein